MRAAAAPPRGRARRSRIRTAALTALAAALALGVSAGVAGCTTKPAAVRADDIEQVTYAQYQALPDFDTTPRTTTDRADIEAFAAILDEYGESGDVDQRGDSGDVDQRGDSCPGSRSTTVDYALTDGAAYHIEVGGCDRTPFGDALDELVSGWRSR